MKSILFFVPLASQLLLCSLLASPVLAHGTGAHEQNTRPSSNDDAGYPPTYFSHPDHARILYAHISLMTLAWVFTLPVAVMLSLAKSRYALLSQFLFTATNSLGLLSGTIYNANTPDLYPNNAHHRVGWVVTWILSAHVLVNLLRRVAGALRVPIIKLSDEYHPFVQVSQGSTTLDQENYYASTYRLSNDSGHGSEPNTESLRSSSVSTLGDDDRQQVTDTEKDFEEDHDDSLLISPTSHSRSMFNKVAMRAVQSRAWGYIDTCYNIVDRIVLPLGFIALTTGIVTFGRFFEGNAIFSGLAHWIKGGVFFWLGLLTLGRWAGSFGNLGWAWNLRPMRQPGEHWIPTAEFMESALIFAYGSTNMFLEHLGSNDGVWSPQDLEHFAITVLFLGGGLCGMLIESTSIRDLLNANVAMPQSDDTQVDEERTISQPTATFGFSLNPIPALVILLLGIMMGGHEQETMISSMIHKQWGDLLVGASVSRGLTYLLVFLRPPQSIHPSRPPTELLAAFGLIAGGIIFMSSSADTVIGMIHYHIDAMSIYTVTLGFVGLLMAWELIVLSIKGWAIRNERKWKARDSFKVQSGA